MGADASGDIEIEGLLSLRLFQSSGVKEEREKHSWKVKLDLGIILIREVR